MTAEPCALLTHVILFPTTAPSWKNRLGTGNIFSQYVHSCHILMIPMEMHGEWEHKYCYLMVQKLQKKVSIGIQTFRYLSGAEISLEFSKEPLEVQILLGGLNYFRSYVNPSLKKQKQDSMSSFTSEAWIHPTLFQTAFGGDKVKTRVTSPDSE